MGHWDAALAFHEEPTPAALEAGPVATTMAAAAITATERDAARRLPADNRIDMVRTPCARRTRIPANEMRERNEAR
jgi:hypothetical protein